MWHSRYAVSKYSCKRSVTRNVFGREADRMFEVVKQGSGDKPNSGQRVKADYTGCPILMRGLYYHFNDLRFRNWQTKMLVLFPFQVLFFVSSDCLKCRLLKRLLAHHMDYGMYDMIYYDMLCYDIRWYDIIWDGMTWSSIVWYVITWSNMTWYDWHDMVLYDKLFRATKARAYHDSA